MSEQRSYEDSYVWELHAKIADLEARLENQAATIKDYQDERREIMGAFLILKEIFEEES